MSERELNKVYDPHAVEQKWYADWEKRGLFHADVRSSLPPFSIVIPPPNITGSLHMGHALNNTLQDILVRWKRMSGFNTLWLPGTDHAGIATQNVVEKQLAQEASHREAYGRTRFVERVWTWREASGRTILTQLKRLGASCDWDRERFTLDAGLSAAVREVFVRLYEEGLIYRGNYITNWCPRCHTALSDLEVEYEEVRGKLYQISYPLFSGEGSLVIATTRPETLLGDTAVAIHPEDERYQKFIGQTLRLPILGRPIPIIVDPYVDRQFGTGALKITPAHDPNDYELGKKHGLESIQVMTGEGRMNDLAGPYAGMDRYECRKKILLDLQGQGLLVSEIDYNHSVGHCYRCKTVIEPMLSRQWFVRMKTLAEPAIQAVSDGRIRFIPGNWEKTYFEWMNNIKDWCISRQIWWGHQIPAWHCQKCETVMVEREDPSRCSHCGNEQIHRDEDVLDTWFSSALWPFSTLGWPADTEELKRYYPTTVLVTGFDILFFWVARMIMMGLKFKGEIPFQDVYIHALVRDAEGRKMSKSKGNVIDPLEIMDVYGTDALRFTLASMASPGRDIKLSEHRIEGYRNFANKIWNATRFILLQSDRTSASKSSLKGWGPLQENSGSHPISLPDRWIMSRLQKVILGVECHLTDYRFDEAAHLFYQFFWYEFCDSYLELSKHPLQGTSLEREQTLKVLYHVLDNGLRLLHPFMPFITEELWQHMQDDGASIMVAPYPKVEPGWIDDAAEDGMDMILEVIRSVRRVRSELSISPALEVEVHLKVIRDTDLSFLENQRSYMEKLGKISSLVMGHELKRPLTSAVAITSRVEIYVPLGGLVDIAGERQRIEREMAKLTKELSSIVSKLSDPNFQAKAPAAVVEKDTHRRADLEDRITKLHESLLYFA